MRNIPAQCQAQHGLRGRPGVWGRKASWPNSAELTEVATPAALGEWELKLPAA